MIYSKKTTPFHKNYKVQNYLKQELYESVSKDQKIFDFIHEAVLDGIWFWDLDNPENEWMSPKFWTTLGYDPKNIPHKSSAWQDIINQEDLKQALSNFVKHCKDPLHPYNQVVRYKHKLGHTVWIQCRGLALRDGNGKPIRMIGAHTDITHLKKAKEDLSKQIERYKHIVESTSLGIWEWNLKTNETIINERWANMLGYSLDELSPVSKRIWSNCVHPDDLQRSSKQLNDYLEGDIMSYSCEVRMKHKAGHWIWVLDEGKVLSWDDEGNPEWMIGSHLEITQTKTATEQNRLFIEQAPSAIAMLDTDMRYLAVSKKWIEDYGIKNVEIIGKSHYEIFPEIPDTWKEDHKRALRGESLKKDEDCFVRKDGSKQWIKWELHPWLDTNQKIGGVIMQTQDITKNKELELANKQKQVFLETILDAIDVGIVSCNEKGELNLFNKATKNWHGLPPESLPTSELSGYYGLYQEDGKTPLQEKDIPLLKALKEGSISNEEIVIIPKKGNTKHVITNGSQLKNENGEIFGAVVAMHDITERKKAEEKLRDSEAAFRGNFENAAIGMAILDTSGKWLQINKSLSNILGYTIEELRKLNFQAITHQDDLEKDLMSIDELLKGKRTFYHIEKRYIHKNGRIVYAILAVSLVRDKDHNPLYFISQIIDITPRIETKNKLRETVARLEGVLEANSQVGIIGTDSDGLITTFNKGAENLLGYTASEMVGKNSPAVFHVVKEVQERGKELSKTFGTSIEGFEIFIALTKNGMHDTREWTYIKKDGTHFPVQLTVTAVRNENDIIGYLGVATDISEIKEAENRLKSLLEITGGQNNRLRNFAHIVSHNLKSHSGNFEMLLDLLKEEDCEEQRTMIMELINRASLNLSETVMHLNEVVLINTSIKDNMKSIPLRDEVEKVCMSISAIASQASVKIRNEVPEDFTVLGVTAYIESVLLNLLTNAVKYRDDKKDCYVLISAKKTQKYVTISVTDNGLGIDLKKHRRKVFGMYKTFHQNKDAKGIGLFISKNQVEAMEGTIDLQSNVNKGTTFNIKLKYE